MSTIREQIVILAMTALNTARPAPVPEFIRTRLDSPSADQLPVNTVYQFEEKTDRQYDESQQRGVRRGPIVRRILILKIESLTKANGASTPDQIADVSLAWATKAIMAAGVFSNGTDNLANNPADEMGTKFEYEQGESSFCRATLTFQIEYQSKATDPESIV